MQWNIENIALITNESTLIFTWLARDEEYTNYIPAKG